MPRYVQTKQIVDQTLKASNAIIGRTGAFAERRAAQGADLMRHETLLAERSQSALAGRASVPKSAPMPKAGNTRCQGVVARILSDLLEVGFPDRLDTADAA